MHPILPQTILPQPGRPAPLSLPAPLPASTVAVNPLRARCQPDRISRLNLLAPEDAAAGLLWLAMNFPDICDAMLDKLEFDDIDDDYLGQEPEPFCAECGSDIGIFLRFDTGWRHYRANGTTIGQIELTDPGHDPVVAWRLT